MSVKAGPSVGEYLRAARNEKGLTLRQAAAASGLNFASISQIETGKHEPKVGTLALLMAVYTLSPSAVFREVYGVVESSDHLYSGSYDRSIEALDDATEIGKRVLALPRNLRLEVFDLIYDQDEEE